MNNLEEELIKAKERIRELELEKAGVSGSRDGKKDVIEDLKKQIEEYQTILETTKTMYELGNWPSRAKQIQDLLDKYKK